jgi:hypothetical protein
MRPHIIYFTKSSEYINYLVIHICKFSRRLYLKKILRYMEIFKEIFISGKILRQDSDRSR